MYIGLNRSYQYYGLDTVFFTEDKKYYLGVVLYLRLEIMVSLLISKIKRQQ